MAQSSFLEGETPVEFLYLDRKRLSSLIGQLSDKGVLTGYKSVVSQTRGTEGHLSGDMKVVTAEGGRSRSASESAEETYDPFWTHAYTFLQDLQANFAVPLDRAVIGSLVKFTALIQFVDLKLMRHLWEPAAKQMIDALPPATSRQQKRRHNQKQRQQPVSKQAVEIQNALQALQLMPHLFHMTFLTNSGVSLWAAVQASNLTINSEDLAMKFGAVMDGVWTVVGIVDGKAGEPDKPFPIGSPMLDASVEMMARLRGFIGRPYSHIGLTPIAIYTPLVGIAETDAATPESGT